MISQGSDNSVDEHAMQPSLRSVVTNEEVSSQLGWMKSKTTEGGFILMKPSQTSLIYAYFVHI